MTIKPVTAYSANFNRLATHPLQSWAWGEFRQKMGIAVYRFGQYEKNQLTAVYQLSLHRIPLTPFSVGYLPKSQIPTKAFLVFLKKFFQDKKVLFVKIEPNVKKSEAKLPNYPGFQIATKPLFTKYTFQIDLTKTEEQLFVQLKPKTRYNIRLAQKKGVKVVKDNSDSAFETYLTLQQETTKRQKFYAHNEKYHRLLWQTLKPAGLAHLLKAVYQNQTIVAWLLFLFNGVLYYPYGGSNYLYRNLMPSNLMLWEAIRWGKKQQAKIFDLWGALGPQPNPNDPWYGFHRFKEGYGGELVEFVGSYDLILNPLGYSLYNLADKIRWQILKLKF